MLKFRYLQYCSDVIKKRKHVFFIAILTIALLSCSKEKSKRWVILDINIKEKIPGITEEARLEIGFPYLYQEHKYKKPVEKIRKIPVGKTKNGIFSESVKLDKSFVGKKLYLYVTPTRQAVTRYPFEFCAKRISIDVNSANTLDIDISQGYYLIKPIFINENCSDSTNKAQFSMAYNENFEIYAPNGPHIVYNLNGCVNHSVFKTELASFLEDIYFRVVSNHNLDTTYHHFNLTGGIVNELEIRY